MDGAAPAPQPAAGKLSRRRALALAVALLASGAAIADKVEDARTVRVEVAYATDRAPSGKADPAKYFGGERGPLSYGMVTVGLKLKKHSTEVSSETFWRDKLSTDKDNGALDITPLSPEGFDQRISERLRKASDRSLLVYVHGYKRSFARSAEDVARIAYGIDYRGIPVVYSWPSRNSAAAYQADATTVRWSALYFRQAVARLAEIHDVDTVHLMAHSMGNQALMAALASAGPMSDDENWKLGEVIMVAPDVDRDRFLRDAMPVLRSAVPRTTLYISNLDVPLRTSLAVNQAPRLGDARASIPLAPGLETIDASEISKLFTGHSYHLDSEAAKLDLHQLLVDRRGAAVRAGLKTHSDGDQPYWEIQPR